ncbi:MAG: hypothetical protein AB7F96_17495 [Beijerinckiaceae bacterium]
MKPIKIIAATFALALGVGAGAAQAQYGDYYGQDRYSDRMDGRYVQQPYEPAMSGGYQYLTDRQLLNERRDRKHKQW